MSLAAFRLLDVLITKLRALSSSVSRGLSILSTSSRQWLTSSLERGEVLRLPIKARFLSSLFKALTD